MRRSTWLVGMGVALADANSKGLKGDARQSFMSTCLSGSHSG
jgi:psiF repeat